MSVTCITHYTLTLIAAAVWCGVICMKAGYILIVVTPHNWNIDKFMWGGELKIGLDITLELDHHGSYHTQVCLARSVHP